MAEQLTRNEQVYGSNPYIGSSQNTGIQKKVKEALEAGVHISACKACADQLGVADDLEKLGIEVKYWGVPLTDILKKDETLLTI